jgi:hypothetical protein
MGMGWSGDERREKSEYGVHLDVNYIIALLLN